MGIASRPASTGSKSKKGCVKGASLNIGKGFFLRSRVS